MSGAAENRGAAGGRVAEPGRAADRPAVERGAATPGRAAGRPALIRLTGLSLAGTFAVVGIIFLVIPGKVLAAFNRLADGLGWPASPTDGYTLYLALAVGYMYLVTLLAWKIARHPEDRTWPTLLVHAKAASAVVCLGLFALQEQYLLYLVNFVVDGAIALLVATVCLRRSAAPATPPTGRGEPGRS